MIAYRPPEAEKAEPTKIECQTRVTFTNSRVYKLQRTAIKFQLTTVRHLMLGSIATGNVSAGIYTKLAPTGELFTNLCVSQNIDDVFVHGTTKETKKEGLLY